MSKREILLATQERRIKRLVHFTNVVNLSNIIKYGLLPISELDDKEIEYDYNDELRLDNNPDSISISITSPNYKMFYKIRCEKEEENWAVIILDVEKVLNLECAFCYTNAANSEITSIPLTELKSLNAFEEMFSECSGKPSRKVLGLRDYDTTDPQAEILVFDKIPVSAIKCVIFEDFKTMSQFSDDLRQVGIRCIVDEEFFAPRRDYTYWQ